MRKLAPIHTWDKVMPPGVSRWANNDVEVMPPRQCLVHLDDLLLDRRLPVFLGQVAVFKDLERAGFVRRALWAGLPDLGVGAYLKWSAFGDVAALHSFLR